MRPLRSLQRVSQAVSLFGSYVVLPALTILISTDVVMRYVFNSPLGWGYEGASHLLLLYFLCGLSDSISSGHHIRMTLFAGQFSPRFKQIVSLLYAVALLVVFGLILDKASHDALFYHSLGSVTRDLQMPLWLWYSGVALASLLLILQVVALSVGVVRGERSDFEDGSNDFGVQ